MLHRLGRASSRLIAITRFTFLAGVVTPLLAGFCLRESLWSCPSSGFTQHLFQKFIYLRSSRPQMRFQLFGRP